MFATKPRKVTLTLLCLVIAFALASVSEANDISAHRRDHVDVRRMLKKRSPQANPFGGLVGLGNNPPTGGGNPTTAPSTDTATTATTNTADSSKTSSTSSTSSSTSSSSTSDSTSASPSTSASSSSSTDASSSSSSTDSSSSSTQSSTSASDTSTSSSATNTAATTQPTTGVDTSSPANTSPAATSPNTQGAASTSSVIVSVTPSPTTTSTSDASNSSTSKITRNTLIVIIVVASSVGIIALGWTLFRKWKLKPSSHFDDRMQPIDWQPTTDEDTGLPAHRREGSGASHGSFHSGTDVGNGTAALNPIPDHDFTAGSMAPVGGYADLQRGPSPQPPQMASLARGASVARPNYDTYGVPLHYQGGAGYDAYDYTGGGGAPRY